MVYFRFSESPDQDGLLKDFFTTDLWSLGRVFKCNLLRLGREKRKL